MSPSKHCFCYLRGAFRSVPSFFFFQYLGEPAEVAREKERERLAGMVALKGCGFAAEEQRIALRRLCR